MKQNITLALEKDLMSELKFLATQLREIVEREKSCERCKNKALAALRKGYHLGGKPASREELHAR